jgi:hypothetical protein
MPTKRIAILLMMLCMSVGVFAADDPFIGTWLINLDKSKFDPGPPPKVLINKYDASGADGLKITTVSLTNTGLTVRQYTEKYDGKEYSSGETYGAPVPDMVSVKRIDAYTVEGQYTRAGKVRSKFRRVVSKDGKTMTTTAEGTTSGEMNKGGQHYKDVRVYDKQSFIPAK